MESIVLKFKDGKEFKLEFNRKSIIKMEEQGFDVSKAQEKPLLFITLLTRGAFYKNHPELSEDKIDEIVEQVTDLKGFVEALSELYVNSLQAIAGNENSGNATWGRA